MRKIALCRGMMATAAAGLLILGFLFSSQAASQTGRRITYPDTVWEVTYTLTIKGEGVIEPELGSGGDVISWKVDRTYTGSGKLRLLTSLPTDLQAFTKWEARGRGPGGYTGAYNEFRMGREKHIFHGAFSPAVRINDSILIKGDELCDEYGVTDESWKMVVDAAKDMGIAGRLTINNLDETHDINLALGYAPVALGKVSTGNAGLPVAAPVPLMYQRTITSYPAKKVNAEKPVMQPNAINLRIPKYTGWIEGSGGTVSRSNIPLNGDGPYTFESGEMIINQTVLKGVDTSGQVKMELTYVIKRLPSTLKRQYDPDPE